MTSMKDQNEVLYYKVEPHCSRCVTHSAQLLCLPTLFRTQANFLSLQLIQEHLKEMFSIIYTPTEGEAIQNFSQLFRRPEGCFLNIDDRDRVEDNLAQWGRPEDIDYIVVTDGEEVTMRSTGYSWPS